MENGMRKLEIAGMVMEIESTTLTPAELEQVSGLTTTLQRVWRRRGEIPERTGSHASFSVYDAASISIGFALNRFGYNPSEAMQFGHEYKAVSLRSALERGGACEIIGTKENVRKFGALFDKDLSFVAALAGEQDSDLPRFLCSLDGEPPRLSVSGFRDFDSLPNFFGYFVNLEAIGARLLAVADRPLLKIRLGPKNVEKFALIKNRI